MPLDISHLCIPEISGIQRKHSSSAIKEARKIEADFDISHFQGRIPVTGITIDSLSSPDLDDGIWCEKLPNGGGYVLQISIASPSELIPENGAIEKEVFQRATSVYFGDSHIYHMLPNIISTGIASLNHQTQRLSLTLELEINAYFEVVRKDLYKSIFYNKNRFDPSSFVAEFADTGSGYYETFAVMHELARGLGAKRKISQRIHDFDDADRRIVAGEFIPGHTNKHLSSYIIQEFMILANIERAKWTVQESVDGIFRSHMPECADGREIPKILRRSEYGIAPLYHTGLGIDIYTHSTSPLRRAADYILDLQTIPVLDGNISRFSRDEMKAICKHINLQITSVLTYQKEELYDRKGKRVIRKSKRYADEKKTSLIQHIKSGQSSGIKVTETVENEILRILRSDEKNNEWIIRGFFLNNRETEIQKAIIEKILSDTKTRKYISLLGSINGINFTETTEQGDDSSFQYYCDVVFRGKHIYRATQKIQKENSLIQGQHIMSFERRKGHSLYLNRKEALQKLCEYVSQ